MIYLKNDLNKKIEENLEGFVLEAEEKYKSQIKHCVEEIAEHKNGKQYKFVLLAGPSSAGKTTTSYLFKENLALKGFNAKVVSIDNFYLERVETPELPNGKKDYDSLRSLDWELFGIKINELIENGKAILPIYDFVIGEKYYPENYTTLNDNEIIVIEGLHALNPIIDKYIPTEFAYKVYLNSESEFADENSVILNKDKIKFVRRLLRDYKKRGSTPKKSFDTWQEVLNGERTYITPFKDNADFKIDTTHAFEPNVYLNFLISVKNETEDNEDLNALIKTLEGFTPIDYEAIPMSSLTQEFLGGNDN